MGWLELFRKPRDRWAELEQALTSAFWKVRNDIAHLSAWVQYFRESESRNQGLHAEAAARMERAAQAMEEQRKEIEGLKAQVYDLGMRLESAMARLSSPFPDQVRTKSGLKSEPEQRREKRFERVIIAKARPVRKEYAMSQILQLAAKGSHTTKQIETIIVREKMLCGRTAFYDYLKELKHRGLLIANEQGIRRVLLAKKRE